MLLLLPHDLFSQSQVINCNSYFARGALGSGGLDVFSISRRGLSSIEPFFLSPEARIANVRLVTIKAVARKAVDRVSRSPAARPLIKPPMPPPEPPPIPRAPPSLRWRRMIQTRAMAKIKWIIRMTEVMKFFIPMLFSVPVTN